MRCGENDTIALRLKLNDRRGAVSMYIELFLLDNLLMNLLVLHLTAVLLSIRPQKRKILLFALGGTAYAAVGAGLFPWLLDFPAKLIAGLPLAFALPVKTLRDFIKNWLALMLATLMAGGAVFAISIIFSEDFSQGITLRTFLIGALAVTLLPGRIRILLSRRVKNENIVQLEIRFKNDTLRCPALVDTGCNLTEPITAVPVILIPASYEGKFDCSTMKQSLPIPMTTAAGERTIQGFRPESICIEGRSVKAVMGFAKVEIAIIPSMLMTNAEGDEGDKTHPDAYASTISHLRRCFHESSPSIACLRLSKNTKNRQIPTKKRHPADKRERALLYKFRRIPAGTAAARRGIGADRAALKRGHGGSEQADRA